MALFTVNEVLEAATRAIEPAEFGRVLGEQILESRADTFFEKQASAAKTKPVLHFDIFLSHAYADKAIVSGVYTLLTGSGFIVYVDWIHDRSRLNRSQVTPGNAAILRERMQQCDSLLFATTQNHSASKWMPWECGYFDGYDSKKIGDAIRPGHVAVLPVVQSASTTFVGQEYLGLYPLAQKGSLVRRNLNIHNQQFQSRYLHFDTWVRNGHP